jgi:hypothetical protein
MKKLALIFASALMILTSKAQITITDADMPQSGRANIVAYDTTTNVNIGSPSATAQVWDFSSLLMHYNKLAIYSPTTPYQAYADTFPGSNIYTWGPSIFFTSFYGGAPVDVNNWGYMYWKTDVDGFHIVGFRGDCGPNYGYMNVHEGPQELLMGTPATYNAQFPDSARWVLKFNKNSADVDTVYKSIRNKTLTVDAFGTLTTSLGTGTTKQVLRVHEYVTEVDSIEAETFFAGNPYTVPIFQLHDTLNNYYFWANDLNYPMAIVHCDKNNVVKDVEYITDTVPCYTVTGNVFRPNGIIRVKEGTAGLYIKDSYNHLFTNLENVPIDDNGHFQFADVVGPNYLVRADPDPDHYPFLQPTYYGDTTYWDDATTLTVLQDTNITINCVTDSTLAVFISGSGSISGTVWMDTTQVGINKNPTHTTTARGVLVTLEQNPGGACRFGTTDDNGYYEFNDLAATNYKLKVDIPGLVMDTTYYISLSSKSMNTQYLDFFYDTTKIYTYYNTGITEHPINTLYDVTIYPNPFNSDATISISNPTGETRLVSFKVYDLVGRKVKEIVEETYGDIHFTSEGMIKGMYIYELQVDHELVNSGKIIVN